MTLFHLKPKESLNKLERIINKIIAGMGKVIPKPGSKNATINQLFVSLNKKLIGILKDDPLTTEQCQKTQYSDTPTTPKDLPTLMNNEMAASTDHYKPLIHLEKTVDKLMTKLKIPINIPAKPFNAISKQDKKRRVPNNFINASYTRINDKLNEILLKYPISSNKCRAQNKTKSKSSGGRKKRKKRKKQTRRKR